MGGNAMSEWRLKDCCLSVSDGDHLPPPKSPYGIPFITISNIDSSNHINFEDTLYVPKDYYDNLDPIRKPQHNDILYSVVGSFGKPVLIKENRPFVFQRHIAILRPNSEIVDSRFLYYIMLSRDFYMQADSVALGAAQRTISLTSLRNMKVNLPDLGVQRRIAEILSRYDSLIENYQRQIKLLEEAAQRLYKEWFVDLHFPGHENTPIIDGIPEGWEKGLLDNIAYESGKKIDKKDRDKYNCYLPIDSIPKHSLTYLEPADVSLAESSLVAFNENDIIFGAMRPYFHKVCFAQSNGLTRTTCFVLNSRSRQYREYLLMLLFEDSTIKHATSISVGTTMPYTRWKDFKSMKVLIPNDEVVLKFGKKISLITQKLKCLSFQIRNLTEARDRLLPKLMSGEIEVS